jgi:3'-phosphoadenosine 5'-phosphosulfate sulfotransferase (PAPS reductase)/FAD synthetase
MSNPYKIDLPAVISFSGGRTSGFMLRHILDAHGGQPRNLKVCFQNTGLEHAATYDFVRECAERWEVEITWLEYDLDGENKHSYQIVDFDTASRNGEPFTKLIQKKGYLPNPVARLCTVNLKMRTMDRFIKEDPDFAEGYTNAVGLRADEPRRVHRMRNDNSREEVVCPMFDAGHTEADVLAFWKKQPFDLMLPLVGNMAGNCVGCFLKGRDKLEALMLEMPEYFEWWAKAEQMSLPTATTGARFRSDRPSYSAMLNTVRRQGQLFAGDEDTIPCFCTD